MFGIGFTELVVILFIILLLFGAKNIPEIARNLGKSMGSFKKGIKEAEDNLKDNDVKLSETSETPEEHHD